MKTLTIMAVTGGLYLSSLYLNKPANDFDLTSKTTVKHCTQKCKCTKTKCKKGNSHAAVINPAATMLLQIATNTQHAIVSWDPLV